MSRAAPRTVTEVGVRAALDLVNTKVREAEGVDVSAVLPIIEGRWNAVPIKSEQAIADAIAAVVAERTDLRDLYLAADADPEVGDLALLDPALHDFAALAAGQQSWLDAYGTLDVDACLGLTLPAPSGGGDLVQHGVVTTGGSGSATWTFPVPYGSNPTVVATVQDVLGGSDDDVFTVEIQALSPTEVGVEVFGAQADVGIGLADHEHTNKAGAVVHLVAVGAA